MADHITGYGRLVAYAIDLETTRRLLADGAQLVEVLPRPEYDELRIPGALSLPLKELDRARADALLDRTRPVVVYCWDSL
jgi:rhodanese-related sulfurtransferase